VFESAWAIIATAPYWVDEKEAAADHAEREALSMNVVNENISLPPDARGP